MCKTARAGFGECSEARCNVQRSGGGAILERVKSRPQLSHPERRKLTLVTRIAATSKSQIASDCNRNSKNHCDSENTLWNQIFGPGNRQFCVVFIVFQKRHMGLETPPEYVATTRVWFWIAAIFLAQCDFCDCDTAILLRFLREKLAISKLSLPIASDLWLRLRGSLRNSLINLVIGAASSISEAIWGLLTS